MWGTVADGQAKTKLWPGQPPFTSVLHAAAAAPSTI